jgi:hypothetical protein
MPTVLIKQVPDDYAESTGLAKYNRSRMPGCRDVFQAAENVDGRFVTGLDEEAYGLDEVEHQETKQFLRSKRETLEKATKKDLNALSPFWENFLVEIHADKPKTFDLSNPLDEIAYRMLVANGFVAPTKDDAYTPQFKDSLYFAYTEESESVETIGTQKKRDQAISKLLEISEDRDKMVLYGQYLEGIKYDKKFKEDTLYKMLRAYIEDKDVKKSLNFLKALAMPVEVLQQKIITDKAIKQRLIVKNSLGGKKQAYQYGQVTLGSTLEEVYNNLTLPDFAPELLAIKKELEK